MGKPTMIEKLKNYNKTQSNLKLKYIELEQAKEELKNISYGDENMANSYGLNSDIRAKNKTGDKVSELIVKNENERKNKENLIREIGKQIGKLKLEVKEVQVRLGVLGDNERKIVMAYYINGKTPKQIPTKLHVSNKKILTPFIGNHLSP